MTHWIVKVKLSFLIIGLACIGFSAWRLNRSRAPMPQDGGVWDLGLLSDSEEGSLVSARSLSNWVQSRKHVKKYVLKWRYPNPSPGWCQWVYTYNRSKGTLKVECSLSSVGPQPGWEYGNVTDDIISQVASRPDRVLLYSSWRDNTLLRQLGCSVTAKDIHTGEIRTYPPL
jgi:hypothetical protein